MSIVILNHIYRTVYKVHKPLKHGAIGEKMGLSIASRNRNLIPFQLIVGVFLLLILPTVSAQLTGGFTLGPAVMGENESTDLQIQLPDPEPIQIQPFEPEPIQIQPPTEAIPLPVTAASGNVQIVTSEPTPAVIQQPGTSVVVTISSTTELPEPASLVDLNTSTVNQASDGFVSTFQITEPKLVQEITVVTESSDKLTVTASVSRSGTSQPITITQTKTTSQLTSGEVTSSVQGRVSVDEDGVYILTAAEEKVELKILPDEAAQKVSSSSTVTEITLSIDSETPQYKVQTSEQGKLLGFIPVDLDRTSMVNAVTGEVKESKNPWWSFLVR